MSRAPRHRKRGRDRGWDFPPIEQQAPIIPEGTPKPTEKELRELEEELKAMKPPDLKDFRNSITGALLDRRVD